MPIRPADILFVPAEGPVSLGGPIGSRPLAKGLNNLWANMDAETNAEGLSDHRVMFVRNNHPALTLYNTRLWVEFDGEPADIAAAVDPHPPAREALAKRIDTPGDSPGLEFTSPSSPGSALLLGDLAPGEARAVWFRRTGRNRPAGVEGYSWVVQGETVDS